MSQFTDTDGSLYSVHSLANADDISALFRRIEAKLQHQIHPLIDRGVIFPSQANTLYQYLRNLVLDNGGLIEYSVERIDGILRGIMDTLDGDAFA